MELFKLLGTVAVDTSEANKNIDETTDKVEKSEGRMSKAFEVIGAAVVAAFAVDKIADFGKAVVGMADDAQKAMNNFSASTGADMAEYEDVLKSIYKNNYGESFEDIAASMATVKQQMGDIGADELEELTTNAIMLRDTFGFEVNESMRSAKMLMDQFNISGTEAFNLIAQGAQKGLDKNGDMLDSINEYAVHYEQLGFTAEGFFASLENGTAAGTFSVDKLGDAVKEFGIRAKDNSVTSRAAFESLGYDADALFDIFNKGGEDAAAMTQTLIAELAGMPDSIDKTTAGTALFGTMWEDLGSKGIQALGDVDGSIDSTLDTLEQINDVRYDSLGDALQGVKRSLETSIMLPLGEKIIPWLMETIPSKLAKIEEWAPKILGAFGTAISGISTAVSTAKEIIDPILQATKNWIQTEGLPIVESIWQSIQDSWATIQPLIEDAAGKISELLGGVIESGGELFSTFSEKFGEIGDVFSSLAETVIVPLYETHLSSLVATFENLVEIWETVVVPIIEILIDAFFEVMTSIAEHVQPAVENIMDKFGELADLVQQAVDEYILPVIQSFVEIIQELYEENKDKLDLIGELFGSIFGAIEQIVGKCVTWFKEKFMPFLSEMKDFVMDNLDRVKEIFQGAIDFVSGIIQTFIALFKGDWEGMWESIKETASAWWETIKNVFSLAWDAIKAVWEAAGISDFFAGIWEGIKSAFGSVADWFSDTFAKAWQGIKDIFSKGGEIFDGITEGIGDFFKTTVNGIIGGINDIMSDAFGGINSALATLRDLEIFGAQPFGWISEINVPQIPLLAQGGVLEQGQVGLLEGSGAEAVVPLENNAGWIRKVAEDLGSATGNDAVLREILEVLRDIKNDLPETLLESIAALKFDINNREFARLVKAVN